MMTMRNGSLLMMAALVAAGCEDSTGPEALDLGDLELDVAVMAAEATLDDVQSMTLATWGIGVPFGAAAAGPEHQTANFDIFDFELSEDQMERIHAMSGEKRLVNPGIVPDWER